MHALRGLVSPDGDRWSIRPCYSRQTLWLKDPEGLLARHYRDQAPIPGLPLYMELQARGSGNVSKILLAGGDIQACRAELDGITVRAAGSEPDWAADLKENHLEVRDQARLMRLGFDVQEHKPWGNRLREWHGAMQIPGGKSHSVELGLSEGDCYDQVGIWYGLQAVVKLDGRIYRGCARYGDLTRATLAGHYLSETVTEAGPLRTLSLQLDAQGAATLNDDEHDGQPVAVRTGNWRLMPTGRLMLDLLQRDGHPNQQVLLFNRQLDGSLVQEGADPAYGGRPIRLSPDKSAPW